MTNDTHEAGKRYGDFAEQTVHVDPCQCPYHEGKRECACAALRAFALEMAERYGEDGRKAQAALAALRAEQQRVRELVGVEVDPVLAGTVTPLRGDLRPTVECDQQTATEQRAAAENHQTVNAGELTNTPAPDFSSASPAVDEMAGAQPEVDVDALTGCADDQLAPGFAEACRKVLDNATACGLTPSEYAEAFNALTPEQIEAARQKKAVQAQPSGCCNCGHALQPEWAFCPHCAEACPWTPKPPIEAQPSGRECEALREENGILRRLLWGACSHGAGYGDDGELQDASALPIVDFKRDSAHEIESAILRRNMRAIEEAGGWDAFLEKAKQYASDSDSRRTYDSLRGAIDSLRAELAKRSDHPKMCPITGREFFMTLEHPERGNVATYGGPFDSYTIPEPDEDGCFRSERYDHDRGRWVEGGEPERFRILTDTEHNELWETAHRSEAQLAAANSRAEAAEQAAEQYRRNWLSLQDEIGQECHLRALETIRAWKAGSEVAEKLAGALERIIDVPEYIEGRAVRDKYLVAVGIANGAIRAWKEQSR